MIKLWRIIWTLPAVCKLCERKIGESGMPLFMRVRIQRHGLDMQAIQRQQGLAMMLGGAAPLAQVMGPNDTMTRIISEVEVTVCEDCAGKHSIIYQMALEEDD